MWLNRFTSFGSPPDGNDIAELELVDVDRDRLERFINYAVNALDAADRPLTCWDLHDSGPALRDAYVNHKNSRETVVMQQLGELPGVDPPDTDEPDWRYIPEEKE